MTKLGLNRKTWTNRLGDKLAPPAKGDRRMRNAKTDPAGAAAIRALAAAGFTQTMIAEAMGLSQPQVSRIVRGEQWQ